MDASLTAAEIGVKLRARELGAVDVANFFLDRIETHDPNLGCFLKVDREWTLSQAEDAQKMLDAGEGGPLTGVPVALKDNMSTAGIETTCASKILEGYVPIYDATVVARLKAAGMPILGKTNLDEFAMGTSTESSAYQLTRNPWDTERSPGGSSGGSAAAVAARLAPVALGSDTGGSIRQPAALTGTVGFKPTYGRCSRYGLVAFGSSLDQIGPLANSVEDAALLATVTTGHDPLESTSLKHGPIDIRSLKGASLKGIRLALPEQLVSDAIQPGSRKAFEEALAALKGEGASIETVSMPSIKYGVTTYYIIAPAEASSNLARFDGIRYGPCIEGVGHIGNVEKTRGQLFGREVRARIMIGTYALSAGYYDAYYLRAQQVRTKMRKELEAELQNFDAIISPTSPCVAFKLGELSADPMALKLLDLCTIPANMGGFPAISLNCGFDAGLPVGLQLIAGTLQDERLLQLAYAVERALPSAQKRPPGY